MNIQEKSYVFGLLATDGSLYLQSQNRGKVVLELQEKDKDIIEKLYYLIPNSSIKTRTRDTNFKENYTSVSFVNYQKDFREELISFGFPTEDKTNTVSIPNQEYSERDFWRGIIDGDGSIGYTKDNIPFVSLVTKSEELKKYFCALLKNKFSIIKNINRNARDNVYNITVKNEDAILLATYLYENSTLYLDRKYNKYQDIKQWIRTTKKVNQRGWTEEEIEFIKTHSPKESAEKLGRTISSIKNKKYRVTK